MIYMCLIDLDRLGVTGLIFWSNNDCSKPNCTWRLLFVAWQTYSTNWVCCRILKLMPDAKQAPGASHVAHSLTRSSILRPIQPTALSGLSRSQPLRFPEPSAESLTTRQKTPHCPDARVSPSTSALAQRALQQLQAKGILAKDSDRTFDFGKTYRHSAADNTSERDRFCYPNRQQKRVLPLPSELNQSKLSSSVLEKEQPSSRILPGLSPRHSRVIRSCQAIEKAISRPQDPSATLQPDASNGRAFLKEVRGASEAVRNITASCLGSSATHSQVPVLPPLPHRRSSSARIQQSRPIDSTKTYLTDSLPSILEKSHSRVSQLSSKMRQPTKSTQHAPGSGTSAELDRTRRPIMPYVHPATSSSSNMASPETRPIPVRRTPAAIRKSSAEEHGYDAASRVRAYENARAAKAAQDAVTASTPITPQNPATPVYARYPQPQYPIGSHTAQAAPIPGYMVYGAQTPSYRLGQNPAHTTVQNPAQNLVPQQNSGPAGHAQPAAQILPGESQWDKEAREAETRNLAVAMENSLREDQGRKANEVPLRDQSLDYILREFPDSVIMRLVRLLYKNHSVWQGNSAFSGLFYVIKPLTVAPLGDTWSL